MPTEINSITPKSISLPTPHSCRANTKTAAKNFYSTNFLSAADAKDSKMVGGMFEAMLYRILLKESRDSAAEDDIFNTSEMHQMREMQDEFQADILGAQGELGLIDFVEQQVKKEKLYDTTRN